MRATAFAIVLAVVCTGGKAVDFGGKPIRKPDLSIYTAADRSAGCAQLKADLEDDRDFRAALVEKYSLHVYDVDRYQLPAALAGVRSLPAFFAPDQRWEGYRGKAELAQRLGLAWSPPVAAPAVDSPRVDPVPAAPPATTSPAVEAAIGSIHTRIDTAAGVLEKARQTIGQQTRTIDELRDLHARLQLRVKGLEETAAPTNLRAILGDHEGRFRTLYEAIEKVRELKAAEAPAEDDKPSNDAPGDDAGFPLGKLIGAAASGFLSSGPIGAIAGSALTVGGWWLRRRFAKRGSVPKGGKADAEPPVAFPIVTETSAPSQVVIPETRFQTIERDSFADSFAWAVAELGRKEPGSINNITALEGLIRQHLASKGISYGVR